jgi:cellulose synthase/poly-beta-1,6-N-acetylglucosamine synthase-like glycosyltransferase
MSLPYALEAIIYHIKVILIANDAWHFALAFMPFILFLELPFQLLIIGGIIHYYIRQKLHPPAIMPHCPGVSVIITCYAEGMDVSKSILSIAEQLYPGHIQIIPVIDGAKQNFETYNAAKSLVPRVKKIPKREIYILPKWKRGGRVSSLNSAMHVVRHEIVLVLDGDSSCDNDVIRNAVTDFADPNVIAVAGALRIRNAKKNLVTRFQAMEYMMAIHASKIALNEINSVNNISGAFGFFRRDILKSCSGWDSGSAEDLDITMRLKSYFGVNPNFHIAFEPNAMALTDGPETWFGLFKQRLRWEGDLYYIYARKHKHSLRPKNIGWKNFIIIFWTGLIFQLIFPLIIMAYLSYLIYSYPLLVSSTVLFIAWLYYFATTLIMYIVHLLFVSERKKYDLGFFWLIPFFPFYTFLMRVWAGVATVSEIFLNAHQDTSMAPWWVLRKSKF